MQHAKQSNATSLCCPPTESSNQANLQPCMLWTSIASMHAHLVTSIWVIIIRTVCLAFCVSDDVSAGAQQPDAEYSGPDVADLFDLPRCNSSAAGGLSNVQAAVDPAVTQLIEGMLPCITQINHSPSSSIVVGLDCLMLLSCIWCSSAI